MEQEAQGAYLGIAVLSPHFVVKGWTMKELQLMLSDDARTRGKRFLPLFYKVCTKLQQPGVHQAQGSCQSKERAAFAGQRARLRGHWPGVTLPCS